MDDGSIRDYRGWLTVDGPRFGAFKPLGSRAQLEYDTLCLAEAYHWDPITVKLMPSSQRHRFVKMKEQIVEEQRARENNQTTMPEPTGHTGLSPGQSGSSAQEAFGIDYS